MSTTIDWPTDLPDPRVDYRRTITGGTIRTEFESGYVQTRARHTKRRRSWRCTLDLDSAAKILSFETFFDTTVEAGASSFNWTDPEEDGAGATEYEVRFTEDSVTLQYIHVDFARVSFGLEEV